MLWDIALFRSTIKGLSSLLGLMLEAQMIAKIMSFHPSPWSRLSSNGMAHTTAAAEGYRPGLCCGDPRWKPTTHTRNFAAALTVAGLQAPLIAETM